MTLWEAYREANRRRAALTVIDAQGRTLRVQPRLGGAYVVCSLDGANHAVPEAEARIMEVTRP